MNYKYIMAISFAAVAAFVTLGVSSVSAQVMNQYAYYASPVPTNYNQTFSAASSVYGYNAWQSGSACGYVCAYAMQQQYGGYSNYQPQYYHTPNAGFYQPAVWYQSTPGFYAPNNGYTPTYQNNYTTSYNSYQTPQQVYYSYGNGIRGFSTY